MQPYNAGSAQDTAALVQHVYGALGVDLDFVIPFAALNEAGATADALTGANEVRKWHPAAGTYSMHELWSSFPP